MKILYAGDSPLGGPANYLLGVLKFLKADFLHLPPSGTLRPGLFQKNFDAVLLSDFPKKNLLPASEKLLAQKVRSGTGFLMVGGWASFSGPFGGWKGSLIEKILPVSCLSRDDRINFPSGAWMAVKQSHPMFRSLSFKNPPVICGLNQIRPRKDGVVLLTAGRIFPQREGRAGEHPLLVIDSDPRKRIAALATDLAPHWCGGLLDWGRRRVKIQVKKGIEIEVGDLYVKFVTSLLRWLSRS